MPRVLLILLSYTTIAFTQSADSFITNLKATHFAINKATCASGQLMTNRATNLFFADRVGYYLSNSENLTLCKNNLTLNTSDGNFSMSHSLFEPSGADEFANSFNAIGLKTNIFNAFQAANNNATFANELGFTFKHFWIKTPKFKLNYCTEKEAMDAKRAVILEEIASEIRNKSEEFEQNLINSGAKEQINTTLKVNFYKKIVEESARKFADLQYQSLFESLHFRRFSNSWTNFNVYLPVIFQKFTVAENLNSAFALKKAYPGEVSISHTRFNESKKAAKAYINLRLGLFANNTIASQMLKPIVFDTYKNLGGKFSNYLVDHQLDRVNIGNFENFLTLNSKVQFVYFPPKNHFGISTSLEKNFGKFNALNGTIGIPIVLIDKQSAPITNLEIQIRYFDITNTLNIGTSSKERVSIGLTWGQPIGRNIY